jgi:hypothetical protein
LTLASWPEMNSSHPYPPPVWNPNPRIRAPTPDPACRLKKERKKRRELKKRAKIRAAEMLQGEGLGEEVRA